MDSHSSEDEDNIIYHHKRENNGIDTIENSIDIEFNKNGYNYKITKNISYKKNLDNNKNDEDNNNNYYPSNQNFQKKKSRKNNNNEKIL